MVHSRRSALSLLELVVVLAIMATLTALLLPAVQRVRDTADRIACLNNLRQLGLACHLYHDSQGQFPNGRNASTPGTPFAYLGWQAQLLPYLEQDALWSTIQAAYRAEPFPFKNPPHTAQEVHVRVLACPSDALVRTPQRYQGRLISLTSYLGNAGVHATSQDGILYNASRVRIASVTDGLSNTLLAGERPPSPEARFGWWYAATGQGGTGSIDMFLGVREINLMAGRGIYFRAYRNCPRGPYAFSAGNPSNPCDVFHFWSFHSGGAPFAVADGSTRFINYSASALMPSLATRAGNEVVGIDAI